jgi:hypothetical protein
MCPFFFSDMNETEFFGQIFEKYLYVKFHDIPSSGTRVLCGRKEVAETALFWFLPLEDGTIGCPETSVINYHCLLHNSPEERSSLLHRGGSLKLRRYDEANSRFSQFCEHASERVSDSSCQGWMVGIAVTYSDVLRLRWDPETGLQLFMGFLIFPGNC